MAPSLRKACHACTKAKRRCKPQLPRCSRCNERDLACTYDLEPVLTVEVEKRGAVCESASRDQTPTLATTTPVFDSITKAHRYAMTSFSAAGGFQCRSFPVVINPQTFVRAQELLRLVPELTFRNQTSHFCHRLVLLREICEQTPGTKPILCPSPEPSDYAQGSSRLEAEKRRLLSLRVETLGFIDFLANFHRLIAVIIAEVPSFKLSLAQRIAALRPDFHFLSQRYRDWSQHFYGVLPADLPRHLSPWHAWVVAEVARRTIYATISTNGLLEAVLHGHTTYRPFAEALPFDLRTGIWEANSEQEWRVAVERHGGVESELVSWREFIDGRGPDARLQNGGLLQRLLLMGHDVCDSESSPSHAQPA